MTAQRSNCNLFVLFGVSVVHYTKDEVDAKMSSALEYKGSKDTYADLPTTGNKKGDVWNIVNADAAHGVNAGDNVAWNGTTWDVLAGVRWTCPPTCLWRTLWPFPTQSWIISASKGGQ